MGAFTTLQNRINALNALKKKEADRNVAEAALASEKGQRGMVLLVLLGIVTGAVFSWLLVRWSSRVVGGIAGTLGQASREVSAAAHDVASSSAQVTEATLSQASSLEETSAASTEVSAAARSNSANCEKLATCLERVQNGMTSGNDAISTLTDSIGAIVRSSEKVAKVLSVIDGIAFQTNILALNAAVEAARAGEAGLGFAVVADEVRNLSQRCAEAARQTSELVEESVRSAKAGESGVSVASRTILAIGGDTLEAKQLGASVAMSTAQQTLGIEQIATALSELERINQRNAGDAERSAAASQEMEAQSTSLRAAVEQLQRIAG
jgi:methyl-accepting chemotaxis protein